MKILNALIFSFIILNLVKKGVLDFHITTVTDICMKEVVIAAFEEHFKAKLWKH